jgi:hypothetical protein
MNRRLLVGAALAIFLAGAAYYASPYWAMRQMREAAVAGQADRLSTYVDFASVRESLKSQMSSAMSQKMKELEGNPFAGFGQMLASAMINTFVDAMVTPEGVASMISTGKAPDAPGNKTTPKPVSETSSGSKKSEPIVSRAYEGLDIFKTTMLDPETKKPMLVAVMQRQGLFGWKLTAIRFPWLMDNAGDKH